MIKHRKNTLVILGLTLTATTVGMLQPVYARSIASQITKRSYAPSNMHLDSKGNLAIPAPVTNVLEAPKGAENFHVTLSGLNVQYGSADLAAQTQRISTVLQNRRVSGRDIYVIARQLEADYQKAGYALVRVIVPPQKLKDGMRLRLVVVHGYINNIDVSALPPIVRGRVKKVLSPLMYDNQLTTQQLERQLLLAADIPGLLIRSTLKAGDRPQSTTLVIDGKHDVVTGSLSIDNGLSSSLGTTTATIGLQANDLFGAGEVSYVSVGGYPTTGKQHIFGGDPRNSQVVGGMTIPLNVDGLWLNVEGVDSKTHGSSPLPVSVSDHFQRVSARLGMKWLRTRTMNTSSIVSFERTNDVQKSWLGETNQELTKDKLRVVRFSQTGNMPVLGGGHLSGTITASFGLNALGARTATADLPLSRQGAEPDFKKAEIEFRYVQSFLSGSTQLYVEGKAQTSFGKPLVSSEQATLGGMNGISAYDSGAIAGDDSGIVRAELSFPLNVPLFSASSSFGSAMSPYIFGAYGVVKKHEITAVETSRLDASSYGVGLRFGISQAASHNSSYIKLEYAHGSATNRPDENRFNVKFVSQF